MRERAQKLLADLKTILLENKKLLQDLEEDQKVYQKQITDKEQPQTE
jgi:hypothetical protein